jgi:hypothetical protein
VTTKKSSTPKKARTPKPPKEPKAKKVSLLDAAAKVLDGLKTPLTCAEIVEKVTSRGLWKPGKGKTPDQTLASAIGREIKGKASRFKKAERGKFVLA